MTNKLKYFIGNWKMFGNLNAFRVIDQIGVFCKKYSKYQKKYKVILCVPNTLIYYFSNKIRSNFISIGAQNCHTNNNFGPYTGSVTAGMLKNVGAKYIILGHSENRLEGETDQEIRKKIESANKEKLNVIFCIGETAKEKRNGKTFAVLKRQINYSISEIRKMDNIIIAYEPRWSIGSGKIPKVSEIYQIFSFIKKVLKSRTTMKKSNLVLYGGSINAKNINTFSNIPDVDGFLIGGSSQSSKKFIDIIKNYYK
jgi:triosephosphate isomerase (TIM)